jgi:hypothetical protein
MTKLTVTNGADQDTMFTFGVEGREFTSRSKINQEEDLQVHRRYELQVYCWAFLRWRAELREAAGRCCHCRTLHWWRATWNDGSTRDSRCQMGYWEAAGLGRS